MNKNKFLVIAAFFGLMIAYSFTNVTNDQSDPWPVPAKYEKMENPLAGDKASLKLGKKLYNKHCKSCHGASGLGDGTKAATLDTPSGDFTLDEFKAQTDGALFYKTIEGRDDMPGFEKKLPEEEDIWSIINYMRTFE